MLKNNLYKKYIILDRDGVINKDSDLFIKNKEEWIPLDNSIEAISILYKAGFKIIVITNQSGIARKLFTLKDLELMHKKLVNLAEEKNSKIEKIYFCPHINDDNCSCRKPKSGMFNQAKKDFSIQNPNQVFAIGDSLRDLIAAKNAGFFPVLVKTGKGKNTLKEINTQDNKEFIENKNLLIFEDLLSAAKYIVKKYETVNLEI